MKRYLLLVVLAIGCDVGEVTPSEMVFGDLKAGKNPCDNKELEKRINVHADKDNPHRFVGTEGDDVIYGTPGDDVIFGMGGDDIICAGDGDDYIDGGDGKDTIFAGAGNDIVHGRGGSDWIYGGPGDDVLFGDILDDHLFGEEGDDILIGGHGTDEMDGGPGNDFMRGDTGNDSFTGGGGYDIVSYATALPPGQQEYTASGAINSINGVKVTFPTDDKDKCGGGGCGNGDGGQEALKDIQEFVGSPFVDHFEPAGRKVVPGFGPDSIDGVMTGAPTPTSTVYIAAASSQGKLVDVGVVVLGSVGNDDITVKGNGDVVVVTANHAMTALAPCTQASANGVKCDVGAFVASQPHRPAPFHYVLAWGDKGNDTIQFSGDFPREFEVTASGGEGDDHLIGGDEQDTFFTGTDGNDHLEGNGGDDALIGESHHTALWDNGDRPHVADYHDGADIFDGGPGNDIAGFARSGFHAIHAQLGGHVKNPTRWWGKAANMDLCGNDEAAWTTFKTGADADLETLEASDGDDFLWGDDGNNTIWGRAGNDHIWGLGGFDTILGADGKDVIDNGITVGDDVNLGDQTPQ